MTSVNCLWWLKFYFTIFIVLGIFVAQTGTRYGIQPTFITTYGLARGAYASSIQKSVTMDDLFS